MESTTTFVVGVVDVAGLADKDKGEGDLGNEVGASVADEAEAGFLENEALRKLS